MQALSQSKQGESYTIKWMFGVPEVLKAYEIRQGSVVSVVQKHPDCLVVEIQKRRIVLGREIADKIKV